MTVISAAHTRHSFNTQPPEGGWVYQMYHTENVSFSFNTQPPEGGWLPLVMMVFKLTSFNTQPPEGGWRYGRQ